MSTMMDFPPTALPDLLDWAEVNAPDNQAGMLVLLQGLFELTDVGYVL